MKSPFPGMDPFIEGCGLWEDFHGHLIERIGESLADTVPAHYLVRTGVRRYVVLTEEDRWAKHSFKPDVRVLKSPGLEGGSASVAAAVAMEAPVSMRAYAEEEFRERFIEIAELEGERRLVTCVEVLSPSNKRPNSPGWSLYQRKRQGFFESRSANFVEIDLVRDGQRMPMVDTCPNSPGADLVARPLDMPYCKVWPAFALRPLPPIPIPLFKPDADVHIEIQPMIDEIYRRWRFHRMIDYGKALTPPLTSEESAWLEEQLRSTQSPPG